MFVLPVSTLLASTLLHGSGTPAAILNAVGLLYSGEKGPHKDISAVILLTHLTKKDSILGIDPKHTTLKIEAAPSEVLLLHTTVWNFSKFFLGFGHSLGLKGSGE